MDKKFVYAVGFLLALSLVVAAGENAPKASVTFSPLRDDVQSGGGSNDSVEASPLAQGNGSVVQNFGEGDMIRLRAGELFGEGGEMVRVQEASGNRMRLEVAGSSAVSSMKMNQEMVNGEVRFNAELSNGKNAQIKVMPDAASETALERLRLRTCSEENNCSIELKEVATKEGARAAYEVNTQRGSRVLGIFRAKMQVRAQVDAENGEVLGVDKPWWSFLATQPEE